MISIEFRKFAVLAARSADSKKGEDILLLDLRKNFYGLSDYLLIVSANSQVHLKTLSETINESLEGEGLFPVHRDGIHSAQWVVLDYGGLMVHLFHSQSREFYSLERIWGEAKRLSWEIRTKERNVKTREKIVSKRSGRRSSARRSKND